MINEITALSCRDFRPHSKPWLHSTLASQVFAPSTPAPTPLRAWSTDAIFCFPRLILHILCKHLLLRGGFDLQLKKKNNLLMQGKKISQYISSQMGKPLCHSRDFRYPVEEITLQPWIPVTVIQRWRYQWCCVNWAVAKCTVPAPPLGGDHWTPPSEQDVPCHAFSVSVHSGFQQSHSVMFSLSCPGNKFWGDCCGNWNDLSVWRHWCL